MSYFLKQYFAFLIIISALLTGCGASVPTIKPFKMDIQQGNVVTSKMLLQLKPGMTKSQVKFIMGTPLVVDSFHTNRWDYFYQMRQAGKVKEQRRVILEFEKDALVRVRGDVVPEGTPGAATGGAATGEPDKVSTPITVEPKAKEEGILDKLKFWKKDPKAAEAKPEVKPELAKPEAKAPENNLKSPESDAAGQENSSAGLGGNKDAAAGDAPSVLAVPIEIAPAQDLPAAEVNKVETPVVEAPKVEPPKVEPVKVAPPVAVTPKVEPVNVEPVKVEPVKPAPIKPVEPVKAAAPAPVPIAKPAEPFSFRIDKNLDPNNLDTPSSNAAPADVQNTAKPKKVEPAPLPDESEPSFFDRMLEKIGF